MRKTMLAICVLFLAACTSEELIVHDGKDDIPKFKPYTGSALSIAVLGETPLIQEDERIQFRTISLTELSSVTSEDVDAIFIMGDKQKEAAGNTYKAIYKKKELPFFVLDAKKRSFAFTNKDVAYEDAPAVNEEYAVGFMAVGEGYRFFGYSPYNERRTKEIIENVYTHIFQTIEEINQETFSRKHPSF